MLRAEVLVLSEDTFVLPVSKRVHSLILGATTIHEFWPAQQFTSIYFYPVLTFSN
jgi:hypothetical protein